MVNKNVNPQRLIIALEVFSRTEYLRFSNMYRPTPPAESGVETYSKL